MEQLNVMAIELVDEAIDFADELAVDVWELDNGATVIDFGVETVGGLEAGLLLAEIQTGGLATVQSAMGEVAGAPLTHVELTTDHPALSLLCSQKAGWELETEQFAGLGSGPARALVAEEEAFARTGYAEDGDFAVLAAEADVLPVADVAKQVAERADVNPAATFLPVFATASITGSVTLAARAAELAVYRLSELGYDPLDVLSVTGRAPVAPVGPDEESAIARGRGDGANERRTGVRRAGAHDRRRTVRPVRRGGLERERPARGAVRRDFRRRRLGLRRTGPRHLRPRAGHHRRDGR